MKILADGKQEVLTFLEKQTASRLGDGNEGRYTLLEDNTGKLVVFLAGHPFVGTGAIELGDTKMKIVDGLAVSLSKKESPKPIRHIEFEEEQEVEGHLVQDALKEAAEFSAKAEAMGLNWDVSADCWVGPGGKQYDRYGNLL